jgi:amino acid adenylation domain-containing protein
MLNESYQAFDSNALDLLFEVQAKGIRLYLEDDQLRYSAPKGSMDESLVDAMRSHKAELIRILQHEKKSQDLLEQPIFRSLNTLYPDHHRDQDGYPLSFAQQRFWFLDQLAGGNSPIYNMLPIVFEAKGSLNLEVLRAVFQDLIHRHTGLSTKFGLKNNEPRQWPDQGGEVPFSIYELSESGEDSNRIQTIILEEGERPFNLTKGDPLIRVGVIRCSDLRHILILTLHHICADGWSLGNLVAEVSTLYEEKMTGKSNPLKPIDIHYGQFALWERCYMDAYRIQRSIHHWKRVLSGAPHFLELPTDRPRPRMQSFHGNTCAFTLEASETKTLRLLASKTSTTPYMVLLSVFAVLLSRYSRQDDILIGSPISVRPHPDTEPLVGLFLNTLPMRVDLTESPDFLQLLQRVRVMSIQAFEHGEVPFDELLQALNVTRSLTHTPLFQVLFALQNAPSSEFRSAGLELIEMEPENSKAPFDLVLSMEESGSQIHGRFRYNTELFDRETIQRMSGHFIALLKGLITQPEVPVHQIPFTTELELQELLSLRGAGQTYPVNETLQELLAHAAEKYAQHTALRYDGNSYTYQWLHQRSTILAEVLSHHGIGRQHRVGVFMERGPDLVASIWAILKVGAAYVPLDPVYPIDRLSFMIEDAELKIVLTDEISRSGLPSSGQTNICVPEILNEHSEHDNRIQPALNVGFPEDTAYIIYTSGSTGLPKGVEVSHANVIRLFRCTESYYRFDHTDVWTLFHSYAFDFSVWEIFGALLYGGTLVLVPKEIARQTDAFYKLLVEENVSVLNQTPSAFAQLAEVDRRSGNSLSMLRWVIFGGEALDLKSLDGWFQRHGYSSPRLVNMYGITETTVHVTWHEITEQDVRNGSSIIGNPIPDLSLDLCDDYGQLVPFGIPGEIVVGGAGVAKGYLKRPELNEQRFISTQMSAGLPMARYYRSGDLARRQSDGRLQYLGRIDQQVKIRGFRIEIGEIESLMKSFNGVSAAVVKVITSTTGNELAGYLVFQPEVDPNERLIALREHLSIKLPEYMVPSAMVTLPEMPLTHNGKVDLKALPDPDRESHSTVTPLVEPRNSLEQFISNLWCELLRLPKLSIHDNFFELGGDSIKAAIFSNRIQEHFGCIFYVVALFEAPTIAELASYITEHYPEIYAQFDDLGSSSKEEITRISPNDISTFKDLIPGLSSYKEKVQSKNKRAIFVLAPPRSGTTLLRVLLGGHPMLFAPPELELMPFNTLKERADTYTGRDSFWLEGTIRALMEAKDLNAEEAKLAMNRYEEAHLSVKEFYNELQKSVDEQILVDKSPSYVLHPSILERIENNFEDAFYIHLHRHPLGMIHSFVEAKLQQIFFRYPHTFQSRELAELIWFQSHENITHFLSTIPQNRQTSISFEDMTNHPKKEMERLCSRIGIPFDAEMLALFNDQEKKRRMTDGLYAESRMLGDVKFHSHKKIDANTSDRWKEHYSEDTLGDLTVDIARQLGYELDSSGSNFSKSKPAVISSNTVNDQVRPSQTHPISTGYESSNTRPLSLAQKRLWFFEQLDGGKPTYNMPITIKMYGELNLDALKYAVDRLQQRHEVLRSTIVSVDAELQTKITPHSNPLSVVDIRLLKDSTKQEHLELWIQNLSNSPFDLRSGPLFRSAVVRLEDDVYLFTINMHHIVSDGWSLGLISRELEYFYQAFIDGKDQGLPVLESQYADYAKWQDELINTGEIQRQAEYWKEKLANIPALLELPTDFQRPSVKTYQGATHRFELGQDLSQKVQKLAEVSKTTPFMILAAVFGILLHKYSGQEEIVIGAPFANRKKAAFEPLIGFFVNTQVLRLNLDPKQSLVQYLKQIKATALEAYSHQDISFEQLVEILQPERNTAYSPLFQVMLSMQTQRMNPPSFQGLDSDLLEHKNTISKYDLSLLFAEEGDTTVGYMEYSTDLFQDWRIRQMSEQFTYILSELSWDDRRTIDHIALQSEDHTMMMLASWNQTSRPLDDAVSLVDLIDYQAHVRGDHIALNAIDRSLTYAELRDESNRIAARIRNQKLKPGSLIAVALERKSYLISSMLGIWKAGHAYVPLDPNYPSQRIEMIFEDAEIALVLTETCFIDRLPSTSPQLLVDKIEIDPGSLNAEETNVPIRPSDIAYVIFTSGSTGRPKGVIIPHRGVLNFIQSIHREPGMDHKDKLLALTTISFDIAVLEIWGILCCGGILELAPATVAKDPQALMERISKGDITIMQATPATWNMMVEQSWHGNDKLKIFTGGEALSYHLAKELVSKSASVWNLYGPTETTVYSTISRIDEHTLDASSPVLIGRPIDNTFVYVLDDQLQSLPAGITGTLYIGGIGVAYGYLNRDDLTQERFISDPYSKPISDINGLSSKGEVASPKMYNTGDLAQFRPDGSIMYLGRSDQQVKLRGFRIELGEIEYHLSNHPGISSSAVVLHGSGSEGKLVAYIIPGSKKTVEGKTLATYLRPLLPEYMIPAHFITMDSFPMTPNGKLDRKALSNRKLNLTEHARTDRLEARDIFEYRMATIWKAVLGVDHISPQHHFFELGGHSLLAVRMMAMVHAEFGIQLPLVSLFHYPTLESFTRNLKTSSEGSTAWPTIIPLRKGTVDEKAIVLIPGAGGNILYMQALASTLGPDIPVYGVQPPGLDGKTAVCTTMDQLASHYLDAISDAIPNSSLILVGHSFGGLLAYEMARQLERTSAQDVHLKHKAIILDSSAPHWFEPTGKDWSMEKWTRQIAEIASHQFGKWVNIDDEQLDQGSSPTQKLLEALIKAEIFPAETPLIQLEGFIQVYRSNLQMDYHPHAKLENLDIHLIRSLELQPEHLNDSRVHELRSTPDLGWSEWIKHHLHIHNTPGDHLTMLNEPHVSQLADIITQIISND